MKIIDAHVHVGQWSNPDFFGRALKPSDLFEFYKKWDIDSAIVIPTDRAQNEVVFESLKGFDALRFKFVPWVKPADKENLSFCKKHLDEISGLKFHPSLDKTRLTDKPYEEFIKFAVDNNLPIVVHCGRWEEMAGAKFPLEIAKNNKNLKVVLSHMGGDTPKLAFKAMDHVKREGLSNVWFDIAGFREYWVIEQGVKDLGGERFLFASDFPLGHPKAAIALVDHMDVKDTDREKIFWTNAAGLFGWEE